MKKKSFTLVEVLTVTVMVWMIFLVIMNLYSKMMRVRVDAEAKQSLIQNSYNLLEKLNVMMKDYTIDYEEYFNRRIVWCSWTIDIWDNFSWNVWTSWNCSNRTDYGNSNRQINTNWWWYYCSSDNLGISAPNNITSFLSDEQSVDAGSGCWNQNWFWDNREPQAFGQYKWQFRDMLGDADGDTIAWHAAVFDDDDKDIWLWPIAIWDNENVQEIYLISKDKTQRTFIRRKFIEKCEYNPDLWKVPCSELSWNIKNLYTLQILKLKWFDAWASHNFNWNWLYDGYIDTWACDYWEWFTCNWSSIDWTNYPWYNLPNDQDDWWVNFFGDDITVTDWDIKIYPTKDSNYAWNDPDMKINPHIEIDIKTALYGKQRLDKINPWILKDYHLSLQTVFNIRNFY